MWSSSSNSNRNQSSQKLEGRIWEGGEAWERHGTHTHTPWQSLQPRAHSMRSTSPPTSSATAE